MQGEDTGIIYDYTCSCKHVNFVRESYILWDVMNKANKLNVLDLNQCLDHVIPWALGFIDNLFYMVPR